MKKKYYLIGFYKECPLFRQQVEECLNNNTLACAISYEDAAAVLDNIEADLC